MIRIQKREECCGCTACEQICPQHCITLTPDDEGFLYPQINLERCIDCHLCEKACPVINQNKERTPIEVYAAYNKNEEVRKSSSSGGIFSLIAEEVINKKGVVFGVKFDEELNVSFDYTESFKGLNQFRGSKYVQASLNNTYKQVLDFLKDERLVLFTGTPCQIAGLKSFLKKDYPNLLLVDLICEGVPSPKVWRKYLQEETEKQLKKNKSQSPISETIIQKFTFRDKSKGWKQHGITFQIVDQRSKTSIPVSIYRDSAYLQALFHYVILRPICYTCPFKKCKSHSDITIADYWGINILHPEMDDDKGTSMVFINTEKGKSFFQIDNTVYLKTEYEESFYHNNVITSVKKHSNRDRFYSNIDNCRSIIKLLNRCTFPLSYKIKEFFKRTLSKYVSKKTYHKLEVIWRKAKK